MEINTNTNNTDAVSLDETLKNDKIKAENEKLERRLEELRKRDPFIYK
jgi:hypothetical protein